MLEQKILQNESMMSIQECSLTLISEEKQQQSEIPISLKEQSVNIDNLECQNVKVLKILKNSGIMKTKIFCSSIEKIIVKTSGNAYLLKVSIGYFNTEISLLKSGFDSTFFQRSIFSAGAYGQVYLQQEQNDIIAIKSISIKNGVDFDGELNLILKEYFALKIASILGYGPKVKTIFGFDLVCFKNQIEYSMEFCYFPEQQSWQNLEFDLSVGLQIMHSLQIVHQDIKVQNICWSPTLKKWIFLDFGFTSFLKQKPGEKTFSKFIGTYNYTSQQMRNLFHLKNPGFVDLYENDLCGLKKLKKNPKNYYQTTLLNFQNSSLFSYFILLSMMEYSIWLKQFTKIQALFQKHRKLKGQFLGLILKEIENIKLTPNIKNKLFIIYEKYKKVQVNKLNFEEQKYQQNCFKCFLKEQQSPIFNILFLNESQLRKLIKKEWNSVLFMKKLFHFFDQILYSNKEKAWKRMRLVTDIIVSQFNLCHSEKSWFWKFHLILEHFKAFFLKQKIYEPLKSIIFFHNFCSDQKRWENLFTIIFEKQSILGKHEFYIYNFFLKLLYSNTEVKRQFLKLKKSHQYFIQKDEPYKSIFKIAELIINSMQIKQKQKENLNQIQLLLIKLKANKFISQQLQNFITGKIQMWGKNSHCRKIATEDQIEITSQPSKQKFVILRIVINRLDNLIDASSKQMESYFNLYPFCKQIPMLYNFRYYLNRWDQEKINEITQDIFDLFRENLQDISHQLLYLTLRWNNNKQKVKQQLLYFLMTFLSQFKKNISSEKLHKYWSFYSRLIFSLTELQYQFSGNEKRQIISSIECITKNWEVENLILHQKVYVILFNSLKKFLAGEFQFDSIVEITSDYFLLSQLKRDDQIFINVVQFFTFCERIQKKFLLCQTSLYMQILSDENIEYIFHQIPIFLLYVCRRYIAHLQEQRVLNTIISFTNYLTKTSQRVCQFCSIIDEIFKSCSIEQLFNFFKNILGKTLECIRKNNYLSAIIFLNYERIEGYFRNFLAVKEMKRTYILSAIGIHRFPYLQRMDIQKMLFYKFRILEENLKPRKKVFLDRKEDYSKEELCALNKKVKKETSKMHKSLRMAIKFFKKKVEKLEKNLKENISLEEGKTLRKASVIKQVH